MMLGAALAEAHSSNWQLKGRAALPMAFWNSLLSSGASLSHIQLTVSAHWTWHTGKLTRHAFGHRSHQCTCRDCGKWCRATKQCRPVFELAHCATSACVHLGYMQPITAGAVGVAAMTPKYTHQFFMFMSSQQHPHSRVRPCLQWCSGHICAAASVC